MPERIFQPLVLALALAVSGCAHKTAAPSHETSNYFGATKVQRYRLANGLKVLILEDHSAPTFSYQTWFHVGSKDELPGQTGLAHFFEHLMFKQTKNHPDGQFDRLLESAGAEGENAFTSRDYTGYVQSLPASKLDLIAQLEADRMVNLLVVDSSVSSEREVVQNERRFRYENNPTGLLYERVYEIAYRKHAYHWPVIGYEKDLNGASRQDFEAFYKRFYAPNNATIVVVGDVDPAQVISTVEKYYGALPMSKIDRKTSEVEPKQDHERSETIEIKSPVEKMVIGYHIPDVGSPDFPAIEAAREILAGGKGSRLYRKLVDSGIATSVDLESAEHAEPGLLLFFINLQKPKKPGENVARKALAVIDREVRDLAAGRIAPEEIQKAVSMHRYEMFDQQASNYNKAQFIGFYETVAGRFERGVEIVNSLPTVDRASILRVVKTYFTTNNRNVVIGVPMQEKKK